MSVATESEESASLRGSLRLALGTLIALPTTMAFLALSVALVVGRSVAALGIRRLVGAGPAERR
jgi:hypothetical protein